MDAWCIPLYAIVLQWMHVVGAADSVLPPTDVKFHCHNMKNTLSWRYNEPEDDVTFKVTVFSEYSGTVTLEVERPNMFQDLSEFSDPENDYAVTVTAVKGGVESEEAPKDGIEYSYITGSKITCNLDLPLVNVTPIDENHLHFRFIHPGVLYPTSQRQRRRKKSHESHDSLPVFDYHIDILNQEPHSLRRQCTVRECQGEVEVHGGQKSYCLNISGEMKKMSVRATQKYCAEPLEPARTSTLAYILPIIVAVIGFGFFIGYMVFVKRTRPSATDPSALNFSGRNHHQLSHANSMNADYAAVSVEPSSPVELSSPVEPSSPDPLLPSDQSTSNNSSTFRDEVRRPLGVPDHENENNEAERGGDIAAVEGAEGGYTGYTQGTALDEEEETEQNIGRYMSRAHEDEEEEQSSGAYEPR